MSRIALNHWLPFLAWLASMHLSVGTCDEPDARALLLVDGETVAATLEELRPDWQLVVRAKAKQTTAARSEYVLWGNYSDDDRSPQVLLTDGTILVGDLARIETESITFASRLWGELQIDRRRIRACLLLPAADPLERDRQWQLLQTPHSSERILLLNGDVISGKLLPSTDRDGGGLFGIASVGIELLGSGATTTVRMDEVRAITSPATPAPRAETECLLGFRDGSFVVAARLSRKDPGLTRITTAAGATLQMRTEELREQLTLIQPRNETVTYLSDLTAIGYKSLPLLTLDWPLGVATNTLGGRLRSGGNVVYNGLGMHSVSRVAYVLDRQYQSFAAELALDDHAQRQGSVVYRVLVERDNATGQPTWSLAFTSPVVRGGDPPLSMSLDVTDATRVALIVEMADRATTRDYANWLNARLCKGVRTH